MASVPRKDELRERYDLLRQMGYTVAEARKYRTSERYLAAGTGLGSGQLRNARELNALAQRAAQPTTTYTTSAGQTRSRTNPLYRDFQAGLHRGRMTSAKAEARLKQIVDAMLRQGKVSNRDVARLRDAIKTGMSARQGEPTLDLWMYLGNDADDLYGYGVYE